MPRKHNCRTLRNLSGQPGKVGGAAVPGDGHMAFIKSPDGISIEILQEGDPLPIEEPWKSMENSGSW